MLSLKCARAGFFLLLLGTAAANATCPTFHTLTNGTPADATQVMDNFNYILQCPGFGSKIGIGTSTPNIGGYGTNTGLLTIYGPGQLDAVLELATGSTVVDGALGGDLTFENTNLTSEKRLGIIRAVMSGAASNDAGGRLDFYNKLNGGGLGRSMSILNTGGGKVAINIATPNFGGYGASTGLLTIYGPGQLDAVLELATGSTVADGNLGGDLAFENTNLISEKRLGVIRAVMSGTASNDAGGRFDFYNKVNGGGQVRSVSILNTGAAKVGINTVTPDFNGYGSNASVLSIYGSGGLGAALELATGNPVADGAYSGDVAFENTNLVTDKRLAFIRATIHGTATNNAGGQIEFYTKANGSGVAQAGVITNTGRFGIGTATPAQALEVNGQIKVDSLASASGTAVCINANVLASCSSSLRYKENVKSASFGLKQVEAMRPVTFKWKGRNERDFGLIAEEVAKIDPLYVTYKSGKIEGVKYPQLTAVLVNAVKELKATNNDQASEIAQLKAESDDQESEIAQLKAAVRALQRMAGARTASYQSTKSF